MNGSFRTSENISTGPEAASLPSPSWGVIADRQAACRATLAENVIIHLRNDSARSANVTTVLSKGAHSMVSKSGLTRRSFLGLSAAAVAAPMLTACGGGGDSGGA